MEEEGKKAQRRRVDNMEVDRFEEIPVIDVAGPTSWALPGQ